jgi:crotonobetainyl-CoA:carnitine CoA-transferase CaiB-like acyl-CoA transferase
MASGLPLDGIRVLELAWAAPGPYCGLLLAQLGADVVKVEPPGGDPMRVQPAYFAAWNAGKRSIALDLKQPADQEVFGSLVDGADALIEGFRPGVAARLGAAYSTLARRNPRLVYVSVSGFGQDGPYRDRPAHDLNYQSIAGLVGLQEQLVGHAEPTAILVSDLASGLFAALGISAALVERGRTGRGRYLDLSMTDSATNWLAVELARLAYGSPPTPNSSHYPHFALFRASDGALVSLGIVYEQHFWTRLCDLLDLPDLRGLDDPARQARADEIRARLADCFARRTADEWETLLATADVPFARVRAPAEVTADPQFRHRELFQSLTAAGGTRFDLPNLPYGPGLRRPLGPPPRLDEHGVELRGEITGADLEA